MDYTLPSPDYNIPSIGTPVHHADEDLMLIFEQPPWNHHEQQGGNSVHASFSDSDGLTHSQTSPSEGSKSDISQESMDVNQPMSIVGASATPDSETQAMTPWSPMTSGSPTYPGSPMMSLGSPMTTPGSSPSSSAGSGIEVHLQNIVSTVNMDCKLDLKKIALHARNAEYNPKRFAAVIMRIRAPRTTALIFTSGKLVCTGAKSEEDSRLAARKFARIVQKLGFPAKFIDFKIQNMVGSCDVKFPIRLEGLSLTHSQFSSYEPELFPGLIYRMVRPRIVMLIFVSGKVVLTGAKVRADIYKAFENIYPILKSFMKQ